MTSRIIRFEVMVISLGLWLITLIILDIKKPNLIIVLLYIEGKKMEVMFAFSLTTSNTKRANLT